MTATADKINLLGMSQDMLEQFFAERDEKPFRARQLMQWIYQRGVIDFEEMTDLSKKLRERLQQDAEIVLPQVQSRFDSADGTVKWLFATDCGQAVETVFIPEPARGTLCISSQVGCALDCAFCATGAQGFNRNLTSAEIIGQVWQANSELPRRENGELAVTNVVFMGMGEPLANYRNVIPVLKLLVSDLACGLSRRRVTISTSGIGQSNSMCYRHGRLFSTFWGKPATDGVPKMHNRLPIELKRRLHQPAMKKPAAEKAAVRKGS